MNVNFIRNKFVIIQELIKSTFDIFLISETKIDDLFPNAQFKIEGFKSFRRLGTYKLPSPNEPTYVSEIQKLLAYYLSSCGNILLLGDFNVSFSNKNMKKLCDMFELNHLIKDPTCFKISNPSCIDNFYTNKNKMFFNSSTVEAGISDHHILICTMLRSTFCKGYAKFLYYRSYNSCNKEQFEKNLKLKILKQRLVGSSSFEELFDIFLANLNEHDPLKKKNKPI